MSEELKCKVKGGCGFKTKSQSDLAWHEERCTGKGIPAPSNPNQKSVTKMDKTLGWS